MTPSQVKKIDLGQVAGVVVSVSAPTTKSVIWSKPLDNTNTNFQLLIWNGSAWVTLGTRYVGEIMYTGLTLAQAQTVLGGESVNWLLADGQSAAGTLYETLTGNSTVPDLSPVLGQAILIKVN